MYWYIKYVYYSILYCTLYLIFYIILYKKYIIQYMYERFHILHIYIFTYVNRCKNIQQFPE